MTATSRQDVSFISSGTRCAATLVRPQAGGSRLPVVVVGPGLAGVRTGRLSAIAERFAEAGLAALVFDYRYLGDSDGQPRQLVRVRRQLADWHAAVAAARGLPGLDPARVALWGGSIGGGHVLRVAARDPALAAVVSHVPLVDGISSALAVRPALAQQLRLVGAAVTDMVRSILRRPPLYIAVTGPPGSLAVLTSPDADPEYRALLPSGWDDRIAARVALSLLLYQPGRTVSRVRCPLFVALGTRDVITPPDRAARLVGAARHVDIRRYPVTHFGSFLGDVAEQLLAEETDFLLRHV
jgi:fermentation-respiration switch protein FrsA (DUF1100 family)